MSPHESPGLRLLRETAKRQKLVDIAYTLGPPPVAGMKRLMWFGDSDTPMPVDVPESVVAKIAALWQQAESNKGALHQIPLHEYCNVKAEANRLIRPYIEDQYPDCKPAAGTAWWRRALRKFGLDF